MRTIDLMAARELDISYPCPSSGAKDVQSRIRHRWGRLQSPWHPNNFRTQVLSATTIRASAPHGVGFVLRQPDADISSYRGKPPSSPAHSVHVGGRGPQPAHNLTTSPELLRRRQEQRAAAQELTRRLAACGDLPEAKALYEAYLEQFNAIHFAALFTSLARLFMAAPLPPPRHHAFPQSSTAAAIAALKFRAELRGFVTQQLLPDLGLRLMGLGPRQLAAVLAALARIDCPPPGFWMSEWLQHFARRVELPPLAADAPFAECSGNATAAGASVEYYPASCTPTDIARAMWALARLQMRRRIAGTVAALPAEGAGSSLPAGTTGSSTMPGQQGPPAAPAGAAAGGRGTDATTHCGVDGPSMVWLQTMAQAFAAKASGASAADLASYMWGAARLGYRPPESVMAELMARCEQLMGPGGGSGRQNCAHGGHGGDVGHGAALTGSRGLPPRELCVVLWALAVLGFLPEPAWLRRAGSELARMATAPVVWARSAPESPAVAVVAAPAQPVIPVPLSRATSAVPTADTALSVAPQKEGRRLAAAALLRHVAVAQVTDSKVATRGGRAESGELSEASGVDPDWWSGHLRSLQAGDVVVTTAGESATAPSVTPTRGAGGSGNDGGGFLDGRQAATCIWAFARLGYRPSTRVLAALLRRACEAPAPLQPAAAAVAAASSGFTAAAAAAPQDLSMASFALGVLRFRPGPEQAMVLLASMAARLRNASPQDLVMWVTALARMRLAVPDPWFAAYLRRVAPELEDLPPLALVNWVDAVARLRTARPPRRSRMELALLHQLAVRQQLAARQRGAAVAKGGCGIASGEAAAEETATADDALAATMALPTVVVHGSLTGDPWVVVALPPAKPPRNVTVSARRRRQRRGHCCAPSQPTFLEATLPSLTHRDAVSPSAPSSPAASATAFVSASAPAPDRAAPKPGAVFIRPAARHLQRAQLLPRLLRLTAARLPQLDLEQHCRLAWAAAHLHIAVRRAWVDRLIAHTGEALERRLRFQQQQRLLQQRGGVRTVAGAASAAPASNSDASAAAAAQVPVVDARWVLKLARAVEMLLRGPRRGRRLELAQRRRGARHGWADPAVPEVPAAAAVGPALGPHASEQATAAPSAAPSPTATLSPSLSPYSYIPRRWRRLLLMAVLPQLSSLTNAQLLRFVRTMARLRGGPAAWSAVTAAGPTALRYGGSCAGGPQRRIAAELGGYCRRRVEATCGGEDACDVTTAELLWWTRGSEEPHTRHGSPRVAATVRRARWRAAVGERSRRRTVEG